MNKPLIKLSATALRQLLISEVKIFVECMDVASPEELREIKDRLIIFYKALYEKEQLNRLPIVWGRNSTNGKTDSDVVSGVTDRLET